MMLIHLICAAGAISPPFGAEERRAEDLAEAAYQEKMKHLAETPLETHLAVPDVTHIEDHAARLKALLQGLTVPAEGPQADALARVGKSLQAMVRMHTLLKPMLTKLQALVARAQPAEKAAAAETLKHMAAVDLYSEKAAAMLAVVNKAEKGTPDEQAKAIKMLEVGLAMIQAGMHKHMAALKQLTHPEPAPGGPQGGMQKVVAEMQASVDAELADPARKHDPLVALDVHMLNAMKQAVAKSEALEAAASRAAAKHPEKAEKYKAALKIALHKVAGELKTEVEGLKEKAQKLASLVIEARRKKAEKEAPAEDAEAPAEDAAEAKAPAEDAEPAEEAPAEEGDAKAKSLSALKGLLDLVGLKHLRGA